MCAKWRRVGWIAHRTMEFERFRYEKSAKIRAVGVWRSLAWQLLNGDAVLPAEDQRNHSKPLRLGRTVLGKSADASGRQ